MALTPQTRVWPGAGWSGESVVSWGMCHSSEAAVGQRGRAEKATREALQECYTFGKITLTVVRMVGW